MLASKCRIHDPIWIIVYNVCPTPVADPGRSIYLWGPNCKSPYVANACDQFSLSHVQCNYSLLFCISKFIEKVPELLTTRFGRNIATVNILYVYTVFWLGVSSSRVVEGKQVLKGINQNPLVCFVLCHLGLLLNKRDIHRRKVYV